MKRCASCKQDKPLEAFHRRTKAPDGRQGRCKECNREQRKAYYRTAHGGDQNKTTGKRLQVRNRRFLYDYFRVHPCVDCGESNPIVLEFDHLQDKEFNVSYMARRGMSLQRIQAEIDKCEVRCANCHKIRTAVQFGWYKDFLVPTGDSETPTCCV